MKRLEGVGYTREARFQAFLFGLFDNVQNFAILIQKLSNRAQATP